MKKNYKIFTLSLLLIISYSCSNSFLEENPKGLYFAENSLITEQDAKAAVDGVYHTFAGRTGGFNDEGGVYDPLIGGSNQSENSWATRTWTFSSSDGRIKAIWEKLYQAINMANWAIKGIAEMPENIPFKSYTGADGQGYNYRDRFIAEARFQRALGYFYMVNFWGPIPMPIQPYIDANQNFFQNRASTDTIYRQIIADLEHAAAVLPLKSNYSTGDKHRASSGSAKAILSKVYLFMGDYQKYFPEGHALNPAIISADEAYDKAMQYAEEVIQSREYALYDDFRKTTSCFPEYEYGSEHVFAFPHDELALNNYDQWGARNMPQDNPVNCTLPGWRGNKNMNRICIRTMPCDYRRWATIIYSVRSRGFYGSRFWDQRHITNQNATGNDGYVIRFAEVYLIYADAANERNNGPTNKAAEYLSIVRKRATTFFGNEATAQPFTHDVEWEGFGSKFVPTGTLYFDESTDSPGGTHQPLVVDYTLVDLAEGVPMQTGGTRSRRATVDYTNLYLIQPEDLVAMTYTDFGENVYKERDWELFWEGTRLFDLRRKRRMEELPDYGRVSNGVIQPKHYLLPIPMSEILVNPNIQQNPGW
ncbi:MAG: RagB/SusD family nutrient uptake outer membrane protein [Niabella sp.]